MSAGSLKLNQSKGGDQTKSDFHWVTRVSWLCVTSSLMNYFTTSILLPHGRWNRRDQDQDHFVAASGAATLPTTIIECIHLLGDEFCFMTVRLYALMFLCFYYESLHRCPLSWLSFIFSAPIDVCLVLRRLEAVSPCVCRLNIVKEEKE